MLPLALGLALHVGAAVSSGETATALTVRTVYASGAAKGRPVEVTLFRWSTDAERAPLLAALSTPTPSAAPPPAGRSGRAGRGGRGTAPPPLTPLARLEAAVKAAPTCGYIWSDGVTGYSIKYAWRSSSPGGTDRIVLVTDRRVGANVPSADPDLTVIEMRLDGAGRGEAKASNANVAVDRAATTLALDDYAAEPTLFKVTR